jgi:elongation factor P hydroxylase
LPFDHTKGEIGLSIGEDQLFCKGMEMPNIGWGLAELMPMHLHGKIDGLPKSCRSAPQAEHLESVRLAIVLDCFQNTFLDGYQTRLCGDADEPLYVPACEEAGFHTVYFVGQRVASALHEIAHWCIAGKERRQKLDYGYWYQPPGGSGRELSEQRAFERVEIKPQALEWIFSSALKKKFFVSVDNFAEGTNQQSQSFKAGIRDQALAFLDYGMPKRAFLFYKALCIAAHSSSFVSEYWDEVRSKNLLPA